MIRGCTTAVDGHPDSVVIIDPAPDMEAPPPTEDQALTPAPALSASATTSDPTLTNTTGTPSRAAVQGSCECPYDTDSAGRSCGGRSTYSRSGGERGECYL